MIERVGIALALALMLMPRIALAGAQDAISVQDLLNECKAPTGSVSNTFCLGFIAGVGTTMGVVSDVATVGALKVSSSMQLLGLCDDKGTVTIVDMEQAFVNWAEAHPEHWSEQETNGVMDALSERWPCPGGDQTSAPSH